MSYQEIKRISQGKRWAMLMLVVLSIFMVFCKRVVRAQNTFETTNSAQQTSGSWTCTHNPISITYTFENYVLRGGSKVALENTQLNKCEPATVDFTSSGIWAGRLVYSPPSPCNGACGACGACGCACCAACACACEPPADIIACNSMDDCLNQGTLGNLDSSGQGKGVVQKPTLANLTPVTSSLNFTCSGNQCSSNASGTYTFAEQVNPTKYYGLCSTDTSTTTCTCSGGNGGGIDGGSPPTCTPAGCSPPGSIVTIPGGTVIKLSADISSVSNQASFTVVNRAPQVSVSAASNTAAPDEEVSVTCHATDPDTCNGDASRADKIAKVTWNCVDKQGNKTGCYFGKNDDWHEGSMMENLNFGGSSGSNPYDSTVSFKAHSFNDYSITCEAQDNDPSNPLSARDTTGVTVGDQPASIKYCGILNLKDNGDTDDRQRNVCVGNNGSQAPIKYGAYLHDITPTSYNWTCDSQGNGGCTGPEVVAGTDGNQVICHCGVREDTAYRPTLSVTEAGSDTPIPCNATVSSKVTCTPKCAVNVRSWGSADDYTPSVAVESGSDVEARVSEQCLDGGTPSWNVEKGTMVSQDPTNLKARINFGNVLQGKVDASVSKGGVYTSCDSAVVDVLEKQQWRK